MREQHFGIVVSKYHEDIVESMHSSAIDFLCDKGVPAENISTIPAPGAFEIPLIAKKMAQTGHYAGIICLGCVIKGETAHFEYICQAVSEGIMQATLDTGIPISFGILTCYTRGHASARSRDDRHNKGIEAAAACWESAQTLGKLEEHLSGVFFL